MSSNGLCEACRKGLHRGCVRPLLLPTIVPHITHRSSVVETYVCCDSREVWKQVAPGWQR